MEFIKEQSSSAAGRNQSELLNERSESSSSRIFVPDKSLIKTMIHMIFQSADNLFLDIFSLKFKYTDNLYGKFYSINQAKALG
jgi:hypothetical protein